jgi:cytochrome P450
MSQGAEFANTETRTVADPAVSDLDPFSVEFLTDPYPFHAALREAGPLVQLSRYGIWAAARHDPVHAALSDWQTFCSSAGVGLSDFRKEKPWRTPSLLLEADPPLHTRTRAVLTRILSPAALRRLRAVFEQEAEQLVQELLVRRHFDAIADLAQAYPLKVFPDAVGLPRVGRENLLTYGNMAFNAFGPRNWLLEEAMANAGPVIDWIASKCTRDALAPDGFGAQIFAAADAGELSVEEASLLVRSFLTAGIDTTVNGLGNMMYCFAQHPDEWQRLRAQPGLARAAFDEVLRYESPVQTFFRTTTRAIDLSGIALGAGEKVLLFLAAANRDPRRWHEPDRFDISRKTTGHLAFGTGIHGCVGQMVARMEAEAILHALLPRVASIKLAGEPRRRLNNTLRALASLPVVLRPT